MTTSTTTNHGLTKYVFSTGARTVRGITKAMNDNWDIIDAELGGTARYYVEDQKSSSVDGGTFSNGAWRTRDLNTEVITGITGASLSSHQVTLPAGTYYVEASAPAYRVARHQLRLRDVTNSTTLAMGTSQYAHVSNAVGNLAMLKHEFTLAGSAAFELQHRCQSSQSGNGFGVSAGDSWTTDWEVYATLMFEEA